MIDIEVEKSGGPAPAAIDDSSARAIVDEAIDRYVADRRARIDAFIDGNFSFRGALAVHRRAAGWDVVRAPVNLALSVPQVALKLGALGGRAVGARRLAARLDGVNLFFDSDVAREVEWRLFTQLLELPYAQGGRAFRRDALTEAILADPRVAGAVQETVAAAARRAEDPRFADWLARSIATYTGTRVASGEIANALIAAGTGAFAFKQATPGMLTLGPILAQAVAHQAAVASFPLGAGLGSLWYAAAPAAASTGLLVGMTGGVAALASVLAAFSGVVTDPVQRRLGLHRRRLHRLVDALERELRGGNDSRYAVRDLYVARVFDIVDLLRAAMAAAR